MCDKKRTHCMSLSLTVHGLDGSCTTDAACDTADTVCSGSSTCVCKVGYVKASGGTTCEAGNVRQF